MPPKLAVVRGPYLNPWDCGNYMGVINQGIELYLCGTGSMVDWDQIMETCPGAKFVNYDHPSAVLDLDPDVIDLPDAHYDFSWYFTERFDRCVVVAWDNLPGKNTISPDAMKTLQQAWKHVARSKQARHSLLYDGVEANKINVIYGAVDTDFFKPPTGGRLRDAILFVGRLIPEKGLLDLIWAMRGVDAELWVAGEGDKAYFGPWTTDLEISWMGNLSRAELAEAYRLATIFCVPSIPLLSRDFHGCWVEQFGQVFIEAMASGLPIVSTTSGAIPEVTETVLESASRLVPARSFHLLQREILSLLSDEDSRNELSVAGRKRAELLFSQDVIGKQVKEWYEL